MIFDDIDIEKAEKEKRQQIDKAFSEINRLNDCNKAFIAFIVETTEKLPIPPIGNFFVENDRIRVFCLGINLEVNDRCIVGKNSLPELIEYSLFYGDKTKALVVFRMYMDNTCTFFKDTDCKEPIVSLRDKSVQSKLLYPIADAMLKSKLFAPIENDESLYPGF